MTVSQIEERIAQMAQSHRQLLPPSSPAPTAEQIGILVGLAETFVSDDGITSASRVRYRSGDVYDVLCSCMELTGWLDCPFRSPWHPSAWDRDGERDLYRVAEAVAAHLRERPQWGPGLRHRAIGRDASRRRD